MGQRGFGGGPQRGGGGGGLGRPVHHQQGGGVAQGGTIVSPEDVRAIVSGDDDGRILVKNAEALAGGFDQSTTRTSIRRLYTEFRQIEAMWRDAERREIAARRATLLGPRLAYQTGRAPALRTLTDVLRQMLVEVAGGTDNEARRRRFLRVVEFVEAIVAYLPQRERRN